MKKLLIASAALAMVAGTVQAQSSVTVYGVLDIAGTTAKTTTTSGVGTSATTVAGTNTNATSVIGIKGTEDLGGGLKAMFDLQGNINANTGVVGTNTNQATETFFDRQAWVGLSSAKLGTIKLGRTADVLDSTEGFANFTQFFDTEAADANGLGNKVANTVRYDSPSFNGLTFAASHSSDATKAGVTNTVGTTNHKTTTYGVEYVLNKLTVGLASGEAQVADSVLTGKLSTVYAGYDFGIANVRAQQTNNKAIAAASNTNFTETKTTEFSALIPLAMLGSGVSAVVHYEDAEVSNQAGSNPSGNDYKQMGLFVKKDLSKRTAVYAGYKNKDVDAGSDVKTTAVGITHSF